MPLLLMSESRKVKSFVFRATQREKLALVSRMGVPMHVVEMGGRLHLLVEVPIRATYEGIREAIPLALSWRDLLSTVQHDEEATRSHQVLAALVIAHREKKASYRTLSAIVNGLVGELLRERADYLHQCEEHSLDPESVSGPDARKITADPRAFGEAIDLMIAIGVQEDEALDLAREGVKNARRGELPLPEEYPISRDAMRARLRYASETYANLRNGPQAAHLTDPFALEILSRIDLAAPRG